MPDRIAYPVVTMNRYIQPRGQASTITLLLIVVAIFAGVGAYWFLTKAPSQALVIYCAHDRVFSEHILLDFEKETGIPVEVRFDTEATKSLGLTELLIAEKDNPRCDVFWNNEQLAMMQLKKAGVLRPYQGAGFARIPKGYKDREAYWTGFAARMRVWIVNVEGAGADGAKPRAAGGVEALLEAEVAAVLAGADLSKVAIAKPLYGTTRTHYTVLWKHLGNVKARGWHDLWRARGVIEQGGNSDVKDLVAAGECKIGLTDTDDFYVAKDEGKPVGLSPFRLSDGRVICIPNTVAIIKGTKRLESAQRLIDYLLSEKVELALANSKSRQIPLGPVDESKLTDEVKQLQTWSKKAYPLSDLGAAVEECLAWLREKYAS